MALVAGVVPLSNLTFTRLAPATCHCGMARVKQTAVGIAKRWIIKCFFFKSSLFAIHTQMSSQTSFYENIMEQSSSRCTTSVKKYSVLLVLSAVGNTSWEFWQRSVSSLRDLITLCLNSTAVTHLIVFQQVPYL